MRFILLILVPWIIAVGGKKKSEYTQKDWDRIAREWEREEMEEDERERKEALSKGPGIQFDPSGKVDTEKLLAQSKRGKPTMVFFNVREEHCETEEELTKLTTRWASLLLNGNVQVQNFPVSKNRAIFMVQDGSLSYEVKNFLLAQKEVESVTIDQHEWHADGDGQPTYPGQDKSKKKEVKKAPDSGAKKVKTSEKDKKPQNIDKSHKTVSDEELAKKLLSENKVKTPKPLKEESNEIPDLDSDTRTDNDIKSEL